MNLERFIKEHITLLNKQTRWFRDQRNFEVGDLVLIYRNNIPQSHWPLGQITKVFPSNDNVLQSIEMKRPSSLMIRPTTSLFMLARKVALNPTPYEEGECFDMKVTLIFYERVQIELIVSLLRLSCFFIIPYLLTAHERKIQQWQ